MEIKEIVLADGELAGFAFVARDEVAGLVTPLLAACGVLSGRGGGGDGRGTGERQPCSLT